jgi:hypothetical protein
VVIRIDVWVTFDKLRSCWHQGPGTANKTQLTWGQTLRLLCRQIIGAIEEHATAFELRLDLVLAEPEEMARLLVNRKISSMVVECSRFPSVSHRRAPGTISLAEAIPAAANRRDEVFDTTMITILVGFRSRGKQLGGLL